KRWHYRACRTGPGMALLYFSDMWLKWEILPNRTRAPRNPRQFRLDRLLVLAFALLWICAMVADGLLVDDSGLEALLNLVFGFVVPYVFWNWCIAFMIFQQHTHPRIPWYSERDLPSPTFFDQQVRATPHVHFP